MGCRRAGGVRAGRSAGHDERRDGPRARTCAPRAAPTPPTSSASSSTARRSQEAQVAQLRQQVQELSRAGAPAGSKLEALDQAGRRARRRPPGTRPVTRPRHPRRAGRRPAQRRGARTASSRTTWSCTSRTSRPWSTRCGPSGAEAMMLMDQRVISTSAVRCVGNVLILQDRVYSPPYKITAIGDPAKMERALEDSETAADLPPVRGRRRAWATRSSALGRHEAARVRRLAAARARAPRSGERGVPDARDVRGVRRGLHHRRGRAAAVRGLAAVVDRRHRRPRADPADRAAAAGSGPTSRRTRRRPRRPGDAAADHSSVAARRRVRADPHPAVRPGLRAARSSRAPSLDVLDQGVGHYAGTAGPGRGRQLRGRRAPGHLRQAVQPDRRAAAPATRSSSRPQDAWYVYRVVGARGRHAGPRGGRRAGAGAPRPEADRAA